MRRGEDGVTDQQDQQDQQQPTAGSSFWSSTAGAVTLVAAVVGLATAIVGLVTALLGPDEGRTDPATPTPATVAARTVADWVGEANAECRTTSPLIADALAAFGTVEAADPLSPGYRTVVQRASLLYAELQSRLLSLPRPTDDPDTVSGFLARYGERANQLTVAAQRLDTGDVRGHGAALLSFSDIGERIEPEMAQLGLSACP